MEVNCETDFVAKNEDFVAFANGVAQRLLDEPEADLESERTEQVAKIGENIRISRSQGLEPKDKGLVESYVHTGAKVAVLLSLRTGSSSASADSKVLSLAKDMCMHIAATSPVCVSRDDVPADLVEKEKDIAKAQAEGKPLRRLKRSYKASLRNTFPMPVSSSNPLSRILIKRSSNSCMPPVRKWDRN